MIEFGKTLRTAREAKGLTTAQIAEITRMMTSTITELENEDFSRIPAPIYGRGFVKLYCEAVGLDPAPLIAEYMEIQNGNRDTIIRERPVAPADKSPDDDDQTSSNEGFAPMADDSSPAPDVSSETPPVATPEFGLYSESVPEPQPFTSVPDNEPEVGTRAENTFARYASPIQDRPRMNVKSALSCISPTVWRGAVVIGALIVLVWAGFLGFTRISRALTAPPPINQEKNSQLQSNTKDTANKAPTTSVDNSPKVKRTPLKVRPLYID